MKNFIFKSSNTSDLFKIFKTLDLIQTELRHQRDDHIEINKDLKTIVKGIALIISAPTEETEEPFAPEDIRDGD